MNIRVWDNKYAIKSDNYCYKLVEIKTKTNEDGTTEEYESDFKWCTNVGNCFRNIVEIEGRKNQCTTMEGYIKHLEKINDKLEENLKLFESIVGEKEMIERALYKTMYSDKQEK